MFIGHFAVGFAAKRAAPRVSLGVLMAAAQFLDLLWPVFVLTGLERVQVDPGNTAFTPLNFVSYPYSHSLAAAVLWGIAAALLYWLLSHYRAGAVVVGLAVVSHWVLDFITHRADLPLYPGSDRFAGLGLWNSVPATVIVEGSMFVAGVWLYSTGTRSRDRIGTAALWAYVVLLALVYIGNIIGPPPPNGRAVAMVALAIYLLVVWAAWFDAHRAVKEPASGA